MSTTEASHQPLAFRVATPGGTSKIAALINAAFRSEKTGQTWLYDSQDKRKDIVSDELISTFIAGENTVMLVGTTTAVSDPVATCYLRKPDAEPPAHITPGAAWLGFLAVSPNIHKRGFGLAMLREAERFVLEQWQVERLEIDFVHTRVQLRAWYERQGYIATGAKRDFFYGKKGHEILADGLEMVVLGKDLTS